MSSRRDAAVTVAGAVVAVLLQIVLAPNIALFGAQPNFIVAYVLAVAIARPEEAGALLPFVLGLLFDLLGTGPVGGMALLLVVVTSAAGTTMAMLEQRGVVVGLVAFVACTLVVEGLYGTLLVALGWPVGLGEAFLYRALPCALYDSVVGLLAYPVVSRLFPGEARVGIEG